MVCMEVQILQSEQGEEHAELRIKLQIKSDMCNLATRTTAAGTRPFRFGCCFSGKHHGECTRPFSNLRTHVPLRFGRVRPCASIWTNHQLLDRQWIKTM